MKKKRKNTRSQLEKDPEIERKGIMRREKVNFEEGKSGEVKAGQK